MKKLLKSTYNLGILVKGLSMVVVLISVTFSWFVFAKEGWINPFDVNVTGVVNVLISDSDDPNGDWSPTLEIEQSDKSATFTEFTGNGERLYIPIVENRTVTGYYLPDYADREKDYMEFDTYIKTNGSISLYLDPESYIIPSDENNYKDYIAGAVRVAFIVENKKPVIWAPNSTYEYSDGTVNTNGTVEESYTYVYENSGAQFIDAVDTNIVTIPTNGVSHGASEDKNFIWGDISQIENYTEVANPIFTTTTPNEGEEFIVKVKVRIWIEGTDREAVGTLIGGKIKMKLRFKSVVNEEGGAS